MEDNLRTLRNSHRILIVTATILLIYGLSIQPRANRYEMALKEFTEMDISIDELIEIQDSLIMVYFDDTPHQKAIDNFLNEIGYESQRGRIVIDPNFGLRTIKNRRFGEIINYFCREDQRQVMAPKFDYTQENASQVAHMLTFLNEKLSTYDFSIDQTLNIPTLGVYAHFYQDSILLMGIAETNGNLSHQKIRIDASRSISPFEHVPSKKKKKSTPMFESISRLFDSYENPTTYFGGDTIPLDSSIIDDIPPPQFDLSTLQSVGELQTKVNIDPDDEVENHLKKKSFFNPKESIVLGVNKSLPNLQAIFLELEHLNYEFIPIYLKSRTEKLDEDMKAHLEISGFKLPKEIAVIGGPLILLFMFLEFLAHLIHVDKLKKIGTISSETFPWVGFYKNIFGRLITILSLTLLIPISCIVIVIKSEYELTIPTLLIASYFIIFEMIALLSLIYLSRIHKQDRES
jgi:hypothetical protein